MSKALIIYYSREGENYVNGSIKSIEKGNTEIVVEYIKELIDADLFKVETVKEYDKSYMTCIEEAKKELHENARPELKHYLEDISKYENVIVAGPCWWGTYPMAIFTQLDRLDFTDKNVYPIMTHEGSGLSGAPQALKDHCKGSEVCEGLAIHGGNVNDAKPLIVKWLKNIE